MTRWILKRSGECAFRKRQTKGLTLVELLLVIVLLAVLMSLTWMILGSVNRKAEIAKCVSNLRQVGAAVMTYTVDSNGQMLPRTADDRPSSEPRGWPYRLLKMNYLGNPDVLFCPSFYPKNNQEAKYKPTLQNASQTYGMRTWVVPGDKYSEENMSAHKPFAAIRNPADFFLLADSLWTSQGWVSQGYGISATKGGNGKQLVHLRHQEKANAFFADGHVEAKPGSYFLALSEPGRQPEYAEASAWSFAVTADLNPTASP